MFGHDGECLQKKSGYLGIFNDLPVFLLAAIKPHRLDGDGQCVRWSVGQYARRNVSKQLSPMRNIILKGSAEMKHVLASLTIGACLLVPSASIVFATGQPGSPAVACGTAPATATPGNAAASPGSPLNATSATSSGGTAGKVYAGSRPGAPATASPNAVSQYDVACLRVTTHVP